MPWAVRRPLRSQIRDQGGDYLLALKGNHKKAYAAVKQHFHQHIEHHLAWRNAENFFDAFDDSHGRTVRTKSLDHDRPYTPA